MARANLDVIIAADPRSLERGLGRASKATDQFARDADRASKRSTSAFQNIGGAAKLAGGAIAGAGIVAGLKSVSAAAAESEKSTARMRAQLKASGISFARYGDEIERTIQKQSRLAALDDEDLQDAFTNIVRTTGDVEKSLKLVGLASDIARARQMDVAKAGELVAKVAGGNVGALRRYGVQVKEGATATEALAAAQRRFGGQAEAYGKTNAAATERFDVAMENLQETIGGAVAPALASVAEHAATFVNQMQTGEGAGGRFVATMSQIVAAVREYGGAAVAFATSTQGITVLSAALGGLVGRFAGLGIAAVVTQIGTMAAAAKTAGGAMAALNTAIARNPIGIAATVIGTVVGALIGFSGASRDAKTSQDDLANAVDRYRDAMRRVADLDIEAAQRKANLKSAQVQLNAAYRERAEARASGDAQRLAAAEAAVAQAKVQVTRASRDLKRTEEDATRTRREGKQATDEAVKSAKDRIATLNRERTGTRENIRNLEETLAVMRRDGATREQQEPVIKRLAAAKREDARAAKEIADETRRIPREVRSQVSVRFSLSGVSSFIGETTDALNDIIDGVERRRPRRRRRDGGRVPFRTGGSVPVALSSQEVVREPSGSWWTVPGAPVAADNVLTSLPMGSEVYTYSGQQMLAAGASRAQALRDQLPHFVRGGKVKFGDRYTGSARREGFAIGEAGGRRVSRDLVGQITAGAIGNRDTARPSGRKPTGPATERDDGSGGAAGGFAQYGLNASQASRARRMLSTAVSIARKGMPYQYGGNGNPSYDCSAYVSRILDAGGIGNGRMVVAQGTGLYVHGRPGMGKYVTWGVRGSSGRNAHTMVKLGRRYFESGGGGGPREVRGWNGSFAYRHVPGFRGGGKLGDLTRRAVRAPATSAGATNRAFDALAKRLADAARVSWSSLGNLIASSVRDAAQARKRDDTKTARRFDAVANLARAEQGRRLAAPIAATAATTARLERQSTILGLRQRIAGTTGTSAGIGEQIAQGQRAQTALAARRTSLERALGRARKIGDDELVAKLTGALSDLEVQALEVGASLVDLKASAEEAAAAERDRAMYDPIRQAISAADVALLRAQVDTPEDRADDVAAVTTALAKASEGYAAAVAANDADRINEFGQQVLNLRGNLEQLTQAVRENTDQTAQMLAEIEKQRADDAAARARLASQQTTDLGRALVDFVNGNLGGRTGLGFQTVGFAGGGVRY